MEPWAILELEKTSATQAAVKAAYARLVKLHRPDSDPEGFRRVRAAYEAVMAELRHTNQRRQPLADVPGEPSPAPENLDIPGAAPTTEDLPPALLEAEVRLAHAINNASEEEMMEGARGLLEVCQANCPPHRVIPVWQGLVQRLFQQQNLGILASSIPVWQLLKELESETSIITRALLRHWFEHREMDRIASFAEGFLHEKQALQNPEAAMVALMVARECAFQWFSTATRLVNAAFPQLGRQVREELIPPIEQMAEIGKVFFGIRADQSEFWQNRFYNPAGVWDWTDQASEEALNYLATSYDRSWAGYIFIDRVAPESWVVRLNAAIRTYQRENADSDRLTGHGRVPWWVWCLAASLLLKLIASLSQDSPRDEPRQRTDFNRLIENLNREASPRPSVPYAPGPPAFLSPEDFEKAIAPSRLNPPRED